MGILFYNWVVWGTPEIIFIHIYLVLGDVLNLLLEKNGDSTNHLLQASHKVLLQKLMRECDIFLQHKQKCSVATIAVRILFA